MGDDFGDRMKYLEGIETKRHLIPLLPICARLDGKCFSKFTRGLERPYDIRMSNLMIETTKFLVEETNAIVGYTQSDEISLIFYSDTYKNQVWHNGRIHKMTSVLASMATAFFNKRINDFIPSKSELAFFDCRVWNVPNKIEATNTILWREQDATKNSISMAANNFYKTSQLHNKNGKDQMEMLFEKGINWNDYPAFFKRGSFVQRRSVTKKFTQCELDELPEQHDAKKNPDLMIERSEIKVLDMPPFGKVINRVEVIFDGADPIENSVDE